MQEVIAPASQKKKTLCAIKSRGQFLGGNAVIEFQCNYTFTVPREAVNSPSQ